VLARVKTLVWNGPFGAFELEPFDTGTVEVAEAAAELTAAGKLVTVAGGGDTVAALNRAGVAERFTYVSTAGGAFLEWLEGKALPGSRCCGRSDGRYGHHPFANAAKRRQNRHEFQTDGEGDEPR
jgi:3-phosphoglycerate kinase